MTRTDTKSTRTEHRATVASAAIAATLTAMAPMSASATGTETAPAAEASGHVVQFVRFQSDLPRETVLAAAAERKPLFEAMPGLVQKYYLQMDEPNTYGGIYIWKSKEAMAAFLQSDTFKAIPAAYGIAGKPQVDVIPVFVTLR